MYTQDFGLCCALIRTHAVCMRVAVKICGLVLSGILYVLDETCE